MILRNSDQLSPGANLPQPGSSPGLQPTTVAKLHACSPPSKLQALQMASPTWLAKHALLASNFVEVRTADHRLQQLYVFFDNALSLESYSAKPPCLPPIAGPRSSSPGEVLGIKFQNGKLR